jgi:hypothetical protein
MGDYGISPMQDFRDPFPTDARRSRQMDPEDMRQRVTTREPGDDMYLERNRSQSNRRSVSRPSLKRTSTTSSIPGPINYELYRFEKVGEDWTDAVRTILAAPQKELAKKAKSGKSKNGKVTDQMQTMAHTRSSQINDLVRKKHSETGFPWEPAYIEEVKTGINRVSGKKDVRVFDLIVARASISGGSRLSLTNARPASISIPRGGERVTLGRNGSKDDYSGDKKDKKDKDGGYGKQGGKKEVSDPDPYGESKLFAPSGKPLDLGNEGHIPFDEVELPPHIVEDQPIGRRLSKNRGGKSQHGDDDGIQVLGDDGAFKDDGAAQILDGMDFDSILPNKGKNKKGKSRSRSKSRATSARARSRSKSQSRSRAHAEHRGKRSERVANYFDENSSRSSDNGSGKSVYMVGEDDDTSFTSSSIHRDMGELGSLHRRGSSKHEKLPFREHYRGPQRGGYYGEQIMIPERPIRRFSTSYHPHQKQIGYGDPYVSGQRSPDFARSPSPRRMYGVPELLYPHQLREEDQRSERYVDAHIQKDRLRQLELDEREREVERKERRLRRISQGVGYVRGEIYHR